ncbi:MAG: undecaprenyl/decaprenyl-phosphate alpha-N-acetylglucosaminyl 1-phosphate transferase [Aquificaceae bacterium]|nr:undecaprenyl/decaprenyl-phosphate alpha-N-acetylglucosaminyl 1-phosphate transferase [Aquificaceae bacterium]MDW8237757.1 MraY family glycosyltransferase [Aquificaceae bacterium]
MLGYLVLGFYVSLILCALVIYLSYRGILKTAVHVGPQQFHKDYVPRLGGVGIFFSLWAFVLLALARDEVYLTNLLWLSVFASLVFLTGFIEDVRSNLSAKLRLFLTTLFSLGFCLTLEVSLFWVLFYTSFLTIIIHGFNLIDGFNGLASVVCAVSLLGIGFVAFEVGNIFVATLSLGIAGAILGFFVFNYPAGFIFLGDGGAYLIGFLSASLGISLISKNQEVSPMFLILMQAYPLIEVGFSFYRRAFLRKKSPFLPDALHLHSLIYKMLIKSLIKNPRAEQIRNPATSPFLWVMNSFGVLPAIMFWDDTPILVLFLIAFILIYVFAYFKMLMRKAPEWSRRRRVS